VKVLPMLAALCLLAAGCGGGAVSGGDDAADAEVEGAWQLVSGTGPSGPVEAPAPARVTLTIEGGHAGGTAACNQYGGSLTIDGDRFSLEDVSRTEMACAPAVMKAEAAYAAALDRVDTVRVEGDRLVLSGDGAELTFEPVPPVPTQALVDTLWRLESLVEGETVSSTSGDATLRLAPDGSLDGSTGCRSFRGRYTTRGDEVVVTELEADNGTAGACGPELTRQDELVLDVLGDGFRAEVAGDRLTLDAGGSGLGYRAG
jgi:heat shock protein HslJ